MKKGVAMKYEYRQISNVMNKYSFEIQGGYLRSPVDARQKQAGF